MRAHRSRRPIALLAAIALLAILGMSACSKGSSNARWASTPKTAATLFVGAINAGSGSGAAAISCTSFAASAKSQARAGSDPGITFSLGAITETGDTANAVLNQQTNVGGSEQTTMFTLTLQKASGLWLVCGQH